MKKGFTLIELLAVIVILAVIALIATPIILNVIEKARIRSVESSMLGYVDAIEKNVMMNEVKGTNQITEGTYNVATLTSKGVNVKGDKPDNTDKSVFKIDTKGKVTEGWATFYEGKYKVYYDGKYAVADAKNYKDKQGILHNKVDTTETSYKTYQVGEAINYDPTTNQTCENPVSTNGTKTGCMKWYVIKNNEESIDVLLDHNTTLNVAYNTSGTYVEYAQSTIKTQVDSDTTGWISGLNPRLITANEIADVTNTSTFDGSTFTLFYFNGTGDKKQTEVSNAQGDNEYAWLFDYTDNCTNYGCHVSDSRTYGYWTSTNVSNDPAYNWVAKGDGSLDGGNLNDNVNYGIRPVITINKNVLN